VGTIEPSNSAVEQLEELVAERIAERIDERRELRTRAPADLEVDVQEAGAFRHRTSVPRNRGELV